MRNSIFFFNDLHIFIIMTEWYNGRLYYNNDDDNNNSYILVPKLKKKLFSFFFLS